MDKKTLIKFGYSTNGHFLTASAHNLENYFSDKRIIYTQVLVALLDYLVLYTKKFDGFSLKITYERNGISSNGTILGLEGLLSRSEIDIGFPPFAMDEPTLDKIDFSYPFELGTFSFYTPKPKYKSRISGIFETFSKPLWVAILISMFAMIVVHYLIMKQKHRFDKFFLHVIAVGVRQSSILKTSSVSKTLLVYSWVVGAMFLCLAFDSVFLGFLAFPPVAEINNLQELATAVSSGEYRVFTESVAVPALMMFSKEKNVNIIARDIMRNFKDHKLLVDFFLLKIENYATVMQTDTIEIFSENRLISEDSFCHYMSAIPVRKKFRYKKLLDRFVHKLVESGIFFKYQRHSAFLIKLGTLLQKPKRVSAENRKLNLTDLASAFIILLTGYFISFLVFIGEIWSNRKKK